jgi:hypothetical protein
LRDWEPQIFEDVMETKSITIRVNAEVAQVFEAASEGQRQKLEALISLKLSHAVREQRSLEEIMDEISQNSRARGLTPEILDSILNDP